MAHREFISRTEHAHLLDKVSGATNRKLLLCLRYSSNESVFCKLLGNCAPPDSGGYRTRGYCLSFFPLSTCSIRQAPLLRDMSL